MTEKFLKAISMMDESLITSDSVKQQYGVVLAACIYVAGKN